MKGLIKELTLLKRIASLIHLGITGTAEECAKKLNISERTFHAKIQFLRECGADIYFDSNEQTYKCRESDDPNNSLRNLRKETVDKFLGICDTVLGGCSAKQHAPNHLNLLNFNQFYSCCEQNASNFPTPFSDLFKIM